MTGEQIERRKTEPYDDLLSDLVRAEADGEAPLTRSELFDTIVQIIVAGNETTANAIVMGVAMLLQQPELLQRLRDDPQAALRQRSTQQVHLDVVRGYD